MDPYMCPFNDKNLAYIAANKSFDAWKRAQITSSTRITCPLCNKTFKSQDFFELHLKTFHGGQEMHGYNFKLGQENRMTGAMGMKQDEQQITHQGEQVCLADYCDIIPCTYNAVAGSPKTK